MKKRIVRFLRKLGLWKEAQEFKDKPKTELPKEEKPQPKIFEIVSPGEDVDSTVYVREKIAETEDGTDEVPNVIKFVGRFWTEGTENNPRGRNGVIRIKNRHNLIIEGGTFYTKAPAVPYGSSVDNNSQSERRHFWIIQSSNITVQNVRVEGSNTIDGRLIGTTPELTPDFWKGGKDQGSIEGAPAYKSYWEAEHAFDVRDSRNITIEDCEVCGVWGDGVYVGADIDKSENITIRNNHFKFVGRQGVAVCNNADGVLIEGNHIELGRRSSIDFEPFTRHGFVRNAIVRNNKLHGVLTAIAALGYGDVSDIQILDNEFSGGHFIVAGDSNPVNPQRRKNWIVKGNARTNWFGSPIASSSFRRVDNILFEGNSDQVSSKLSKKSIDFINCGGEIVIKDNNFFGGEILLQLEGTTGILNKENNPQQIIIND